MFYEEDYVDFDQDENFDDYDDYSDEEYLQEVYQYHSQYYNY